MELSHLLQLVSEIPQNSTLQYVRGTDQCKFVNVDIDGERINSVAPNGEDKSWAPSYLEDLSPKIFENEPFNLSGLLNNKGSYRPVLETIIAHTREFYTVKKGTATALVWIPSKPKANLGLEEIALENIPDPLPHYNAMQNIDKEQLEAVLKNGFIKYFSNYLRLSTGKEDTSKVDFYLKIYEKQIGEPIKEKIKDFTSIFAFDNIYSLNNFLTIASKEVSNLSILLEDKWPTEKAKQTLYYEPWTMIRHYRAFLDLLNTLNQTIASNGSKFQSVKLIPIEENTSHSQYLTAMRTKPFLLLAGISGTGKSRIVKEMAFASCPPSLRQDDVTPGNYCMIEVKPNWHDSTELIGYVSSIPKPHYVVTPFVNFLIKAMHNPKVPFFVCLDEMNLAPVEQYFAEFLSVLESRKLVNGEIVSEALIKPDIFSKYYDDFKDAFFRGRFANGGLVPEEYAQIWKDMGDFGLRLPSNVIVVGTVNMDETTYQFSRKVIDRAMTIEMNEVDFDSMFGETADTLKYRDPYVGAEYFLPKYTAAKDALSALNDADRDYLKENIPATLKSLDAALVNTPFRIAYRVENELILYFAALQEEQPEATADALLATAVDDILMMKVLPRIEGNEDVLTDPLNRLEDFTRDAYPKANAKVGEMQARLEANHFTSFWP